MPILLESDPFLITSLAAAIGPDTVVLQDVVAVRRHLTDDPAEDLVVIGPDADLGAALEFATAERVSRPTTGVVLVRRRVDTTILRNALRAGIREVVKVDDLTALNEACRQSRELSRQVRGDGRGSTVGDTRLGELLTVFSAKGGCGKTTVATNLAAAMAKRGKRVCLVDLDLAFGDVAIALQLFPSRSVADAVGVTTELDSTAIRGLVTRYNDNLDTILAPVEPGAGEAVPGSVVADLLQALKRSYDWVVVDTPPAFNDHVLAACDATDEFVLVTTLDVPALKNLKLTLEMLELLGYSRDRQRVVLNRADAKVGLTVDDAQKALNAPIALQVPSSAAVPTAINRGVPIVLDQPGHAVSAALQAFGDGLAQRGQSIDIVRPRRGFSLRRRTGAPA